MVRNQRRDMDLVKGESAHIPTVSQKYLFHHIKSLPYYELTRRCSHLPLSTDFTTDLCCMPSVCAMDMCIDAEVATDLHSQSGNKMRINVISCEILHLTLI